MLGRGALLADGFSVVRSLQKSEIGVTGGKIYITSQRAIFSVF